MDTIKNGKRMCNTRARRGEVNECERAVGGAVAVSGLDVQRQQRVPARAQRLSRAQQLQALARRAQRAVNTANKMRSPMLLLIL